MVLSRQRSKDAARGRDTPACDASHIKSPRQRTLRFGLSSLNLKTGMEGRMPEASQRLAGG
jgi:hypothetical protein